MNETTETRVDYTAADALRDLIGGLNWFAASPNPDSFCAHAGGSRADCQRRGRSMAAEAGKIAGLLSAAADLDAAEVLVRRYRGTILQLSYGGPDYPSPDGAAHNFLLTRQGVKKVLVDGVLCTEMTTQ